jgi:hypothetical protein
VALLNGHVEDDFSLGLATFTVLLGRHRIVECKHSINQRPYLLRFHELRDLRERGAIRFHVTPIVVTTERRLRCAA